MRLSTAFFTTLRDAPAGIDADGHKLLLRAGFVRQIGAGLFAYLPLAKRSMTKIEQIIREEIDAIGGQEMTMPVVQPADIWKQSGRWESIGPEMGRFKDRKGHDMVLAVTHEEAVTFIAASEVRSYRQLPQIVYHFQTKFRDEARPRAGLIRVREFTMKDSYSLDADDAGLDASYNAHHAAYFRIFKRCGLPVVGVDSDVGMMGGTAAREYMFLAPIGEDTLVTCDICGYAANRQVATFAKPPATAAQALPIEKVATPDTKTIDDLARLLNIAAAATAKAVFLVASNSGAADRFVFAVVRGDMQLNETKLTNALGAEELRPATEAEVLATGAVPGYASPIGLKERASVMVIVDDAITASPNLVAGANDAGYHLLNTNCPRDYVPDLVVDIAAAGDGDACPDCGAPLRTSRGVEVGNIFKLGTRYSAKMGATFLDAEGKARPIVMGSYGIGVGRLLACIAELHRDDAGLRLPAAVAPFGVHLVMLSSKDGSTLAAAQRVYQTLIAAGIDVLFDDRDETPGVKFADADLIGCPLRLTVSAKSLGAGGVELKRRDSAERQVVPEAELTMHISALLAQLRANA
jgi:prolyl-tRNA synthetase